MESKIDTFNNIIKKIENKVDYADIIAGSGESTSIGMKDQKIQEITTGTYNSARIRVLNNGAWGFAYTNDLNKIDEIVETAIKISKSLKGDITLSENKPIKDKTKTPLKIPVNDISIEEKKELLNEVSSGAQIGKVTSTTVTYSDSQSKRVLVTSEGAEITSETTRIRLSLNTVSSSGTLKQMSHGSIGGVKGYEVIENEDIEKFSRNIGEKSTRLLDAEKPPSGQFTVITDNELTGVFIHEALGHASESDIILQNDSVLKGKLGETIGSEVVNIFDDPTNKDGFGYYEYDVEGVKTNKNQLVKDGKLVSLLSSRETASKLDLKSSGNARSSIGDQPIVRMSNTYLQPGNLKFDELIEDIKEGIYLKGSRGGQVDTGKGIFQFNATEAYKIENGEIKNILRDVSLSGQILETLKNVEAVDDTFKLSVGFCGKDGQTAPVGDGGPNTKILNATVGGSN